ncbi:MAG: hypothetical protein EHM70_02725 [Chloroflexota bacterium]|nr:MAG: hypothetical protein EHM70_02725 [Chloroflexota bacterium]
MATRLYPSRYLAFPPLPHLQRPLACIQPILARPGKPSVDVDLLRSLLKGYATVNEIIPVQSPEHWNHLIHNLDDSVDAILPLSNPAYPTEIWNSHPQALIDRGIPLVFWSLLDHDEPDFWRYAARDMLHTLGATVHIVRNTQEGIALVKSMAMKRFLEQSKVVVFGEQNFPWNANAVGHRVAKNLGTQIIVRPLLDIRSQYPRFSPAGIQELWEKRRHNRYVEKGVRPEELSQALCTYLAIRAILEEEQAIGFGVNCFGDLVIQGGRDVPCLAQLLLREEGYVACCDGDFIALMSMALSTYFLDKPCMMSNLYPVAYVGALADHFGDPLSPPEKYPRAAWSNFARLAHCGFVGVVSAEMTSSGLTHLHDWGGTYEIKRDGRGCGADGDLIAGEPVTVVSLVFDSKRLMITGGTVAETTRHTGMPHCEASALLEIRNLPAFFDSVSRDHVVIMYGDHVADFAILASVLGLEACLF